ncbi:uncharacterized protein LOC124928839 [Impatiens glandulifera]|uniref:uncharacterized protein LOC124928839 n=1 Tax=Impatiens glandulifera TaxID=253017 RepID=UPI001FB110F4|nr:uncharacterized protein LOC124928839 [Impatiens glandulifera]
MRYINRNNITQESPQQPAQWSSPQQPTPLQQVQWSSPQQPIPLQQVRWSTPPQPSQQERVTTEDEANNGTLPTNEMLDGLPSGWRIEVKSCKSGAHKGREYKAMALIVPA